MFAFICVAILLLLGHGCFAERNNTTFVASNQWKEIPEGQAIPAGLHVQIDMQTLKKSAKLLEKDVDKEEMAKSSAVTSSSTNFNDTSEYNNSRQERPTGELIGLEYSPTKDNEKIKRKYRSHQKHQKGTSEIRKMFKTDAEIMSQLMQEFLNISEAHAGNVHNRIADLLRILKNFREMVHQIDNGVWFVDKGGLEKVLLPIIINQTNVALRVQSMRLLGALAQNNPGVKIKIFEKNFGSHLAQVLTRSSNTDELSSALYALGAMLREFPLAQRTLLSTVGTQALVGLMVKDCDLHIKAKAVTLISDIVVEQDLMLATRGASQGAHLDLPGWLLSNDYCEAFDTMISFKLFDLIKKPNVAEYFALALENTMSICAITWTRSTTMYRALESLQEGLNQSENEYHKEVALTVENLLVTYFRRHRTEL